MSVDRVVVYSGGMDSYSLLREVVSKTAFIKGDRLFAISFLYKQRHEKELLCAEKVCALHSIPHTIIHLPFLHSFGHSALTGHEPIPHGHYEAEVMKKTVVPGRNTVMLAAAMAYAEGIDPEGIRPAIVYYGAHAGDHHIYPDCRPAFANTMALVMSLATEGRVSLRYPYINSTKGELLVDALQNGVKAVEYIDTWTCYEGGEHPCGQCGSCVERAEAFTLAGVIDPLIAKKEAATAG